MNTKKYKREIILRLDKNKITTYNEIKIVNRNNICIYTFTYDTRIFDKHVYSRSHVLIIISMAEYQEEIDFCKKSYL